MALPLPLGSRKSRVHSKVEYDLSVEAGAHSGGTALVEFRKGLGGQVANAGMEAVPEQGRGGEDEIGEASGIGVLLFDPFAGRIHQQAIQNVRGFRSP